VPVYSFDQAPREVQALLNRAKQEGISPMDVCQELDRLVIGNAEKLLLICDGLGIPFSEAKEIVARFESGSTAAWGEKMNHAIDEIASDLS
jgi:hypothetical protein